MSWATEADVVTLTGTPADAPKLAQAQSLIEIHIGRTEAMGSAEMTARDLEWLRRAVSYQAAWLAGQPDLHTRLDVKQLSQDGMSATFEGSALVLAPLAKRVLRKLSWLGGGTRSVEVEPHCPVKRGRWPVGGPVIDYVGEPWQPIGPYARRRY